MKKSQSKVVLEHLKTFETITSYEAFTLYGITRLSAKIFDLRKEGVNIESVMTKVDTRYGSTMIAVYTLR